MTFAVTFFLKNYATNLYVVALVHFCYISTYPLFYELLKNK